MDSVSFEVVVVLVLIALNGLLSMAEIAVVSSRRARLQQRADEGDPGAAAALELAQSPSRFLSTVQVGITLVGVLAGAYGGATIAEKLAVPLGRVAALEPYASTLSFFLVVSVITALSLVLGELVPKRLGLQDPERVAALVARPMRWLSEIASPVVEVLSGLTDAILRLFGVKPQAESPVTEEEIKVLIDQGTEAGVFEETEQTMVKGVFRLADLSVAEVMTRRSQLVCLDVTAPVAESLDRIVESRHSYFPVYEGAVDDVLGVVSAKELLTQLAAGQAPDLRVAIKQPLLVPESLLALQLLERFKASGRHVALVVDEYGGLQGLVRMGDLLEAIVGDLGEDGQVPQEKVVRREDGSYLLDGLLLADELKTILEVDHLPRQGSGVYETVAGFVLSQLGKVPTEGDHFVWNGLRFEVMDMDGKRVDKVLVSRLAAPTEPG